MDRLPTLIALLALCACDGGGQKAEPTSRVNAAKTAAKKTDTAAFCDKQHDAKTAPVFAAPPLASGELAASKKW